MITFLKSNLTFGTTNTMSTIIINYQLIINIKFRTIIRNGIEAIYASFGNVNQSTEFIGKVLCTGRQVYQNFLNNTFLYFQTRSNVSHSFTLTFIISISYPLFR